MGFIGLPKRTYKIKCMFLVILQEHKLNAHPCVEVYDDSTIQYMVPLDNQDDFYVPEAKSG